MIAIREIQEVKSRKLTIPLPPYFRAKRVEIIVLPLEEANENDQNLQSILLRAPVITAEEVKHYQQIREWMSAWIVSDF